MPIYEYRCDNCSHEFESIQKVSDAPLTTCPACAKDALRKKVSAAGFRLKGAGWYETDFKSSNKRNVSGDNGSSRNGDGGSSDGSASGKDGASASKDGGSGGDGATAKSGGESSKSDGGAAASGSAKAKAAD
jgi:putative FmdB family regulatory protein